MAYIKIFRSMAILQKEKLVVIKKELLHLRHIADFYREEQCAEKPNPTQREIIAQKIYDDIDRYIQKIKQLNQHIDGYYKKFGSRNNTYLEFLTLYDHYNNDIKEILKIVRLIQSKFLQFQHEHFNQYMPVPNINKRYSTKGFLDYLKIYHSKVLEKEGINSASHPITLWGHLDTFVAHSGKDIGYHNGEKYIEIPFWHYEIPFMLPFITHEIGHIVLDKASQDSAIQSNLSSLKEFLLKNENIREAIKGNEGILDEILSDIFALLYHGEAYVIAQAHELLGKNFGKQFYSQDPDSPISIADIDAKDLNFTEALIRLLISIEIYKIFDKNSYSNSNATQTITEIEEILNWLLLPIRDTSKTFEKHEEALINELKNNPKGLGLIYHEYYGITRTYIDFHYTATHIKHIIIEIAHNNKKEFERILKSILSNDKTTLSHYKETYAEMIHNRIEKQSGDNLEMTQVVSKNEFRKLLLYKDGALGRSRRFDDLGNLGKPYELTYFKTRTDKYDNTDGNYLKKLEDEIIKHHKTVFFKKNNAAAEKRPLISPYFTFDYFTVASLSEKNEKLYISDINDFMDKEATKKDVKFYAIKHSLILLHEKDNDLNNNGAYSVFLNFSLIDNNSEQTKIATMHINTIMDDLENIKTYKIFKSLGPKEIVLYIQNVTLENIFEIKGRFFVQNEQTHPFHRSYTVIAIDREDISNMTEAGSKLQFGSYIRAKISTKIPSNENIDTSFLRTGVQDYMIKWKRETSLSSIIKYYDTLINEKKCTDIQTFVSKEEDLTGGESS